MDYKYQVAISFAEEDRNAALALTLALELAGINKVYYYPIYYEVTWGSKIDKKLHDIYSEEAQYAIVMVSKKYFEKKFTQIELDAIKERMQLAGNSIYMLPVVLEEGGIDQMMDIDTTGYLKWDYDPKIIASILSKILGKDKKLIKEYVAKDGGIIKSIVNSDFKTGGNLSIEISGDTPGENTGTTKSIVGSTLESGNNTEIKIN